MNSLDVWRGPKLIGSLTRGRSGLRYSYDPALLREVGLNRPLVSISMPTSNRPYSDRQCLPFFDGLLPEGQMRRIVAYDSGISESDTFGLLHLLGRDCAGALSILPAGESPPTPLSVDMARVIPRSAIDKLIRELRVHPLGIDNALRASLGGVQEKLLLTRRGDDWALPEAEVASTHLLKPEIPGLSGSVPNEACCLRFAAALGIPAASVSTDRFGDRDVLVVERFDRRVGNDGIVDRRHQENACQALIVPVAAVARKYEESGGPSLRRIAAVLAKWSGFGAVEDLLRQLVVNVLVGNADAHAMNHSFTIGDDGEIALAPMYDVFSTLAYPHLSSTAGMFVAGHRDIRTVTVDHLVSEAEIWGLPTSRAQSIVAAVLSAAPSALALAVEATPGVSAELVDLMTGRINAMPASS